MGEEAEILLKRLHVFIIFQADFKWEYIHEVRADLGPNCLQRFSADDTCR